MGHYVRDCAGDIVARSELTANDDAVMALHGS